MAHERLRPSYFFDQEKIEQLKQIAPECFEDGKINFETLRQNLGDWVQNEEDSELEHFGLFWPGKRDARKAAALPPEGTLEPMWGEGLKADGTPDTDGANDSKNIFIEGENLEVLKILQKSYAGKIKMIYIDPPYNTGNDFVYDDDFTEPLQEYLRRTGQVDEEGKAMTTNKRSEGRFHSKWLSMMYPRLRLAANLLKDDGVIFVSLDDNEINNLRSIMNEIFGEENFVAQLTVLNNPKGRALDKFFSTCHEYVVIYSKNVLENGAFSIEKSEEEIESDYQLEDENGPYRLLELRNTHREFGKHNRANLYYPFYVDKDTNEIHFEKGTNRIKVLPNWNDGFEGCWTWGKEKSINEIELLVAKNVNGETKIYRKSYGTDSKKQLKSILQEKEFHTEKGQKTLNELFGTKSKIFQAPKSVELIKTLLKTRLEPGDVVLDFFCGSGTTGHAMFELQQEMNSKCKFMCIQLPELIAENSEAWKAGYKVISQISKDRLRKVIKKMNVPSVHSSSLDLGFQVKSLQKSNFQKWKNVKESNIEQLELQIERFNMDPLRKGWSQAGLLTEILLIEGLTLCSKIEKLDFKSNNVYQVHDEYCNHSLIICLDENIHNEFLNDFSMSSDDVFICLDSAISSEAKLRLSDKGLIKTI